MSAGLSKIVVEILAGDRIEADRSSGQWKFTGVFCSACAKLVSELRKAGEDPQAWPLPVGTDHSSMLVRELILRARGNWSYPFQDHEICHCRAIPVLAVDQAILSGAQSAEEVSLLTTASTACGTCRPDVLAILSYRQQSSDQNLTG